MKATIRSNRASVSLSLICLILALSVAIFGNVTTVSAEGAGVSGNNQPNSASSATKTASPASGNNTPGSCALEPGQTPKGLNGNVNTRYDVNPPLGVGYINNNGPCVWVVYLASYRMAGMEQINGQTLYDSASVTIYPGQRLTLQVKVPVNCRTQVDLVADKVVDLSNVNYPIYHESGRYIAGLYAGGSNMCIAGEGTPVSTTAAPTTAVPTTTAPTTVAPTTPVPTTTAPATNVPTTAAPTTPVPTTSAPVTSPPATAAPTTPAPTTAAPTTTNPAPATTSAPVTSAPVSTGTAPSAAAPVTTTPPSAVLSGEATRPPAAVAGTGTDNAPNPAAVNAASAPRALPNAGQGDQELSQSQINPFVWLLPILMVVAAGAAVGLQLLPKRKEK